VPVADENVLRLGGHARAAQETIDSTEFCDHSDHLEIWSDLDTTTSRDDRLMRSAGGDQGQCDVGAHGLGDHAGLGPIEAGGVMVDLDTPLDVKVVAMLDRVDRE
jgi:hypothetical protein